MTTSKAAVSCFCSTGAALDLTSFASFAGLVAAAGFGRSAGLASIGGLAAMVGFEAGAGTGRFGEDAGSALMDDEDPEPTRFASAAVGCCCIVVVVIAKC